MSVVVPGKLLVRNSALNLLGQLLPLVTALLAMPYVMRGYGSARFGLISIIWVALAFLTVFDFGLSRATTKLVAEALGRGDDEQARATIWKTLQLQLVIGLLGMLALIAAAQGIAAHLLKIPSELQSEARWCIIALSLSVPLNLGYSSLRGALEAAQRFDLVNVVRSPLVAGNFFVPALGVYWSLPLPTTVLLLAVVRVLAVVAVLIQTDRVFPRLWSRRSASAASAREIVRFGGWVAVSSAVSPTLAYLDRLVLGSALPIAALGQYTVSHEAVTRLAVIPNSIVSTLFPAFSSIDSAGDRDRLDRLVGRGLKYLLLMLGPVSVALIAFATQGLTFWMGSEVASNTATALRILAVGMLVNGLAYLPYSLIQATGRPDLTAKAHLIELPLQIALAVVLVGKWGITGAALAWTGRVAIDAALLFVLARRYAGMSAAAFTSAGLSRALVALALLLAVAIAVSSVRMSLFGSVGLLGLCTVPLIPLVWFWLLDSSERAQITAAVVRRGR